jgi:hypothetical protein
MSKIVPTADRTEAQVEPPAHRTAELSGDSTNPTFGTVGPTTGFPFLAPPEAAGELGRLGEYRVLALLGEGGMGFVFRGEDTALRRPVALKVMRPEVAGKPQAADRFLREGRAAAAVKSDHVVTIYQVGRANGVPFLAMEFLEGLPVDAWLKRQAKPVPPALAVRIARDALRGLAAAHAQGLVHRDIKPANLWIERGTSRIKVLDFGLTRGADGSDQMTVEGAVVGTPAFMAPEQAAGRPVDPRADLFSVGTVLYTLLAGKNPFQRETILSTLGAVGFDDVPPVHAVRPDVPAAVSAFVARLMSKSPDDRPADAAAALRELAAIDRAAQQSQATVAVTAVPLADAPPEVWSRVVDAADAPTRLAGLAAPPPKPPAGRRRLVAGGLFGFLAAALGGIVIVITHKDGTKTTVEVPDGAAVEVRKDGKTVAAVGPKKTEPVAKKPAPVPAAAGPLPQLAERVLARGGKVLVDWKAVSAPAEAQVGERSHLQIEDPELTDADLGLLKAVDGIRELYLIGPITDRGVEALLASASAPQLTRIMLASDGLTDDAFRLLARLPAVWDIGVEKATRVTGRGLAHFKGRDGLRKLSLQGCGIQDEHLAALADLPKLERLLLCVTPITDAGLAHVGRVRSLNELLIQSSHNVTDAGMKHLEGLPALTNLEIGNDKLTGAALASVGKLRNLRYFASLTPFADADLDPLLGLERLEKVEFYRSPGLTDAGLAKLAKLMALRELRLDGTGITADGVKRFRAARPDVTPVGDLADKK